MEPKITGFVNVNAGFIDNAAKDPITIATIGIGAKAEQNGYYAQAEGGIGRVIYAKVEAGKDIPFGDSKFGLNVAVGGQYTKSTKSQDYYRNIFQDGANSPIWKANDTRGYGQLALTYNATAFKASVGIKGGVKSCSQPSLDGITLAPVGEIVGAEYAGGTTKSYLTPSIDIEAGKKVRGTFSLASDCLLFGGKLYF